MSRWNVCVAVAMLVVATAASLLIAGEGPRADGLPLIDGVYEGKMKFKSVDQLTDGKSSKDTFEYTLQLLTKGRFVEGLLEIDDGLGLTDGNISGKSVSEHSLSGIIGNGHLSLRTDDESSERVIVLLGRAKGKTLEKRKLSLKGVFIFDRGATQGTITTTAKRTSELLLAK